MLMHSSFLCCDCILLVCRVASALRVGSAVINNFVAQLLSKACGCFPDQEEPMLVTGQGGQTYHWTHKVPKFSLLEFTLNLYLLLLLPFHSSQFPDFLLNVLNTHCLLKICCVYLLFYCSK